MQDTVVSWQAPEFIHVEKSSTWYLWSIGIALAIALISFFQRNLLFMLFVILAEAVLLLFSSRRPALRVYGFTESAFLLADESVHPLTEFSAYAFIEETDRYSELILRPAKKTKFYIKVLIPHERVSDTTQFLSKHLRVFEYQESLPDALSKRIGL